MASLLWVSRWLLPLKRPLCLRLLVVAGGLCFAGAAWAADPDSAEPETSAPVAESPAHRSLEKRLTEAQNSYGKGMLVSRSREPVLPDGWASVQRGLWWSVVLLAAGGLALRKFAPETAAVIGARLNPWKLAALSYSAPISAEEEAAYLEFRRAFRIGPDPIASTRRRGGDRGHASPDVELAEAEADPLKVFFAWAPRQVQVLRKLLQEIGGSTTDAERQETLGRLGDELQEFKGMAGLPEVLPAWQMASALEWLVKQLAEKDNRVNPSTLRTVANGVDALAELCRPGLRPDLCTTPPIRMLAVDDDAISRHALSFALKKGVGPPDLAEEGSAALVLAAKDAYDVIFLDVQMPGMDGFEVCSRIHETVPNRHTPVVFVTTHSDFEARAKSTLSGGNDLISKPFYPFEITVKALTLALRARLAQAAETNVRRDPESPAATTQPESATATAAATQKDVPPVPPSPELVRAFAARAKEHLGKARELVRSAGQSDDDSASQQMLVELFRRVGSLGPIPDGAAFQPAAQVAAAVEALLKKLLEHPKNKSSSTFQTLATALDLLAELCVPGTSPGLDTKSPVRLLVADDDPISRRAISGGLQLWFDRPDSAADGAAALVLATENSYDAIFLDVEMPGIDGFNACARIHETTANRNTPVVFVTTHNDEEARWKAVQCGGSDFITKPFLCSELVLKALTLALRNRR